MFPWEMNQFEIPTHLDEEILDKIKDMNFKDQVDTVLKTVYDPEIPVDIVSLGLVYDVELNEELRSILIKMTLTAPACPVADIMPDAIKMKLMQIPNVSDAVIELVWEPPWDKDMMTEEAKLELNMY